jgi:predicted deacylase
MVGLNVAGAFRVMRHLGMLPGEKPRLDRAIWIEPSEVLTSPGTGLWYPAVAADQHIQKGDLIGRLTDYFGTTIAEVRSPLTGVVLYVVVSPAMSRDEPIAMVGTPTSS